VRREETFPVSGQAVIDVELAAGSLLVRAGTTGSVAVSVEASDADRFDIGQLGDTIALRTPRRGRSARVVVDAPVGSHVTVKAASLDVSARGALGTLRIRSASGDLEADDLVRADVTLASGDCRVGLIRDDATFSTTSGDVAVRSVGGRLSVTAVSGDVSVDHVQGDVEAQSTSGDVTVRRCDGSAVSVRTVSGSIRLGLPSGIRVEPELATLSGRVTLPDPAAPASDAPRRTVRVRLRSVSGDLAIERTA